ncbi:MAG: hypothetical protein WCO69_06655 [Candidatus Omnitrophota bacterium]
MKKVWWIFLVIVSLAGCAVNTRYVSYTGERLPEKGRYYFVSIYPEGQLPKTAQAYRLIGKVELTGRFSENISSDLLADEARNVARAKGADAIINASSQSVVYDGLELIPGRCGRHYCRPDEYIPYRDTMLTFRGELAVFTP